MGERKLGSVMNKELFLVKLPSIFVNYRNYIIIFFVGYLVTLGNIFRASLLIGWIGASFPSNIIDLINLLIVVAISFYLSRYKISWHYMIEWISVYTIYSVMSYIVQITYKLNDPDYRWMEFNKNQLFNLSSLSLLLIVSLILIGISFLNDKVKVLSTFGRQKYNYVRKNKFSTEIQLLMTSCMLAILILTDNLVFQILIKDKIASENVFSLSGKILVAYFLLATFSCVIVKGIDSLANLKFDFFAVICFSFILAILFNFFVQQSVQIGESFFGVEVFRGAIQFQFWTLFFLYLFTYVALNRYLLASVIIILFSSIFVVANGIKIEMRGEPILPSDLTWLSKPLQLLGFVNNDLSFYLLMGIIALAGLLYYFKKQFFLQTIIKSWKVQLAATFFTLIPFYCTFQILSHKEDGRIAENIPVLSVLQNSENISWQGSHKSASYKSLAYSWVNQLSTPAMYQPKGYSISKMNAIEEKYSKLSEEMNKTRTQDISNQTVIYVLSESFANPERLSGIQISRKPVPKIQEIMASTTSGTMRSDGFGGGTANMEFQTLTGLPFYNLNPVVSVMYLEVVPQMNRFVSISDFYQSKDKYVIHLANKSNYSRDIIYKDLKFDHFISEETKGISLEKEGLHASDKSTYRQVLSQLNQTNGQFFSVITMQNHGIWMEDNPEDLTATGEGFNPNQENDLNSYVKLLSHTDDATKEFLDQLSKVNKPVTVVFYGDHLPGLYPIALFKKQAEKQYETDYFIWSNFKTEKRNYPLVNSSDFGAMVFEQTDSKVSPYYALLTEVLHKTSVDKDSSKLSKADKEIAEDLKLVEYDIVNGKGYLSDSFFKIK